MAIIGIDLGTSNSAAALMRDGRPLLVPRSGRGRASVKAFPSFVAFAADGTTLFGEAARRQRLRNPEGTATGFKRGMGCPTPVRLRGRALAPEQLSGLLLAGIRREAEAFLGASFQGAVVSVPTHFDDDRRRATREACRLAGFSEAAIVDEPTAAAVARGLEHEDRRRRVLVVDFGAGSLDVTGVRGGGPRQIRGADSAADPEGDHRGGSGEAEQARDRRALGAGAPGRGLARDLGEQPLLDGVPGQLRRRLRPELLHHHPQRADIVVLLAHVTSVSADLRASASRLPAASSSAS